MVQLLCGSRQGQEVQRAIGRQAGAGQETYGPLLPGASCATGRCSARLRLEPDAFLLLTTKGILIKYQMPGWLWMVVVLIKRRPTTGRRGSRKEIKFGIRS